MSGEPGALTLSEEARRHAAGWAADCAELTVPIFERCVPGDLRPGRAVQGARWFARGDLSIGEARRRAAAAHAAAREASCPAARAAARAAGHAAATAHMASHALGAPSYAALAARLSDEGRGLTAEAVCRWAVDHASADVLDVLRRLPMRRECRHGIGRIIFDLDQALRAGRPV